MRRMVKKWGQHRRAVFSRVVPDHPDEHLEGQEHMFWAARYSDKFEYSERFAELSHLPALKRGEMAVWYIRMRLRDSDNEERDPTSNELARAQAAARTRLFRNMTLDSDRVDVLALAAAIRKEGIRKERTGARYNKWFAGTPNPFCVEEQRPHPVKRKDKKYSSADALAAMNTQAPVQSTRTCELRGRYDTHVGDRPQKFVLPKGPALEYIAKERPDLLEHVGPSDVMVSGSWETSMHVLESMANQNKGSGHVGNLIQAVALAGGDLKLQQLPCPAREAIEQVLVNPSANPGLISSRIAKDRKGMFRVSAEIAKQQYSDAKVGFSPDYTLWGVGGREKPMQHAQPGDPCKSRMVLMPETSSALLESTFSQPLTRMIQRVEGDIAIGMEVTNKGFNRLTKKFSKFSHCKAYDWSQFDSRCREDMIVAAFGVMRSCFHGDEELLDNLFLRFISHTLVKQVVTPGGWYYTVTQGVPSGSPFTSLLDSIINWMVLVDLESSFVPRDKLRLNKRTVYGDDFVQGWGSPAPSSDIYVAYAFKKWGFIAKPKAIKEGPFIACTTEASLPFLSFRYPNGLPARPLSDAVRLALLPKKPRFTYASQAQRLTYLSHFPPFDFDVARYHIDYLGKCFNECNYAWGSGVGQHLVDLQITRAMSNFGGSKWADNRVFNDEWFRAQDPRDWSDVSLPLKLYKRVPKQAIGQGRVTRNLATLRWGPSTRAASTREGVTGRLSQTIFAV